MLLISDTYQPPACPVVLRDDVAVLALALASRFQCKDLDESLRLVSYLGLHSTTNRSTTLGRQTLPSRLMTSWLVIINHHFLCH